MSQPKGILYRGVPMIEGWPEKVMAAQQITQEGRATPRIRYGDEHDDWGVDKNTCPDCRVLKGEFHVPSCNFEECPVCGGQLLSCDCIFDGRTEDAGTWQ